MQEFIDLLLKSGKKGMSLGLYTLAPVMIVMMAVMRVLEKKGILARIALVLSPALLFVGLPAIGVFAMMQISFVSFAAPLATLSLMEHDPLISKRRIAATMAMIFTMSQANASLPLVAVGLNLPMTLLSSFLGGLIAASLAYYVFTRGEKYKEEIKSEHIKMDKIENEKEGIMKILLNGGSEGLQIVLKSIPILIIAVFIVDVLRALNFIHYLSLALSPILESIGLSTNVVPPIAAKFMAGGTAMMGIVLESVNQPSFQVMGIPIPSISAMSALELNKIAGLIIHPFDLVGIALYSSVGKRSAFTTKAAMKAAGIAILFRTIFHLLIF